MKTTFEQLLVVGLFLAIAGRASAHGTPIVVGVSSGKLTAVGAMSDPSGFAPQLVFEDDEDGDDLGAFTLPSIGSVIRWQIPGFDIAGLNNSASLSIEVLARPVKDAAPAEERVVWYWDPASEEVLPSSANIYLLGTGARYATLPADDETPPAPFLMASTLTGHQGSHNHTLLSYGLDNDDSPPDGAYGFFARLTSNQYQPSDPFLIVFNLGVEYDQMELAALAINAAAVDSDSLPGDYNSDGTVDAADYVVWRKSLTSGDYAMWQNNYGRTQNGSGGSAVPEPGTLALFACAMAFVTTSRRARLQYARKPAQFGS